MKILSKPSNLLIFFVLTVFGELLYSQIQQRLHPPAYPNQNSSNLLYHADGPVCTDGTVTKMLARDNKIFITGYFSSVGKCSGSAVLINTVTKKPNLSPNIIVEGGQVNAIVSDGAGGWYIGGNFQSVGGVPRAGLARLNSAQELDLTFIADVVGEVKALYKDTGALLVGGRFTMVKGTNRLNFASLNLVSGNVNAIEVSTSGDVLAFEKESTNIILGGAFDLVGSSGILPAKIFELDSPYSGLDLPLVENVASPNSLEYDSTTIYKAVADGNNGWFIAGDFDQIDGVPRNGIARINSDGSLHAFDPDFIPWWSNSEDIPYITSMAVNGNDIWISGSFMNVNGSFHPHLVVLDKDTAAIKNTNFCSLSVARDIKFDGTNAFLAMDSEAGTGGYSNHFGGTCFGTAAAVNTADGTATTFPVVNAPTRVSIPDGAGGWYIGGSFSMVGSSVRHGIARINSDGSVHAFSLNFSSGTSIDTLFLHDDILYFSGYFTTVEGQPREGVAAYDISGSSLLNWAPSLTGNIADWETDGTNIYFVGSFEYNDSGTIRNHMASIDASTQALTSWAPGVTLGYYGLTGIKYYSGNLYISGDFSEINGTTRNNLASISTAGVLQAWNPNSNSVVHLAHLSGSQLFIFGDFSTINGSGRSRMASFTLTDGNLTSWNPNPNNDVQGFADDGTNLFVSGRFTTIAGSSRHRIASFSLATRNITAWTTSLRTMDYQNNYQLGVSSGKLLLGGNTVISHGGTARDDLAAINKTTYALSAWNPGNVNGNVSGLAVGASLYVIGGFTHINGTARNSMASLNLTTAALNAWNPNPDGSVIKITNNGTNLYILGSFTSISGQARAGFVAYNLTSAAITAWNPTINFSGAWWERTLAADDSRVFVSGSFSEVSGSNRLNTVTLDPSSGAVLGWTGHFKETMLTWANSEIMASAISGGKILIGGIGYYGGSFTKPLAKVDNVGVVQNWYPNPDGPVEDLEIASGTTIFVGGSFTNIGGSARNYLAEISSATASATPWTCNTDGAVTDILKDVSNLFIAGSFSDVNGSPRNFLAAVDAGTGNPVAWDPALDGAVNSMALVGTTLFVGGDFTSVNSQTAFRVAGIDISSEALSELRPPIGGSVRAIATNGSDIYIGGSFSSYNAQKRSGVAAIDETNGKLLSWAPVLDGGASAIAYFDGKYYVGGSFSLVDGNARGNIAAFDATTLDLLPWNPAIDASVTHLEADANRLYVLGDFANIDATPRNRMASFDTTSGLLTGWDPNPNLWWINEVVLAHNVLWVGGGISSAFGLDRNSFLAFDTASGNMTTFDPPPDNDGAQTMAVGPTTVFAYGSWNYIGNRAEPFVEINIADSTLTSYNPDLDAWMWDLKLNVIDSDLYFTGVFNSFSGQPRHGIAVVDIATKTLKPFDFNFYNTSFRPYKSGSNVYFYGGFNSFEGLSRQGIYLGY